MKSIDTTLLTRKVSSILDGVAHIFGNSQTSSPKLPPPITPIVWPDSASDTAHHYCCSGPQPASGGYNEAFIMEHWASYNPRC